MEFKFKSDGRMEEHRKKREAEKAKEEKYVFKAREMPKFEAAPPASSVESKEREHSIQFKEFNL